MTGLIDHGAQALVKAAATVEGASTHLADFNSQLDQAAALIKETTPHGYQDLHFALNGLKNTAHTLMQETTRVAAGIRTKGQELAGW